MPVRITLLGNILSVALSLTAAAAVAVCMSYAFSMRTSLIAGTIAMIVVYISARICLTAKEHTEQELAHEREFNINASQRLLEPLAEIAANAEYALLHDDIEVYKESLHEIVECSTKMHYELNNLEEFAKEEEQDEITDLTLQYKVN